MDLTPKIAKNAVSGTLAEVLSFQHFSTVVVRVADLGVDLRMESTARSPTASPMIVGMGTPPLNSMPWFDGICSQGGPKPPCCPHCAHVNKGRDGGWAGEGRGAEKQHHSPAKGDFDDM